MQVDRNSHQDSELDTQANSEVEKPKQPRVGSKRFFGSHASRRSFLGRDNCHIIFPEFITNA